MGRPTFTVQRVRLLNPPPGVRAKVDADGVVHIVNENTEHLKFEAVLYGTARPADEPPDELPCDLPPGVWDEFD